MAAEVPTPRITCRAEGHFATCPDCGREIEVRVVEHEDPEARFVLSRNPDGSPAETVLGSRTEHDLSAYEAHYGLEHCG